MTVLADALVDEGYVVFAPDVYRGKLAETIPYALWLRLGTPTEQVYADVDSALTWLREQDEVDAERVASMGFCFGGGHSLQLGMRQSESLALTVMYYGAVVTEPDLLRPMVGRWAICVEHFWRGRCLYSKIDLNSSIVLRLSSRFDDYLKLSGAHLR